ncbi:TetR/AcrR family transcriptional regulator [Paenibacillus soyae]|uniref:TetR/AcrR family transcriptional regulator n=1 Tax=Paenibacillus soyae TaxID=2969249 RepID=A0A9X2SCC3_9BACL|nr:TetR/AcrR family transcriptional regulator [Paenibacillus soyae]MCR2805867.1 TetR/AcrR family transcriptional regulator [Paenibacillus soyae]
MKQEERREHTIRLLLETTEGLVREKGCHAITMKDIMERSGLSKGAIFHYVKSKDELYVWLLQKRLEETNRQFHLEVASGPPTFEGPMGKIEESIQSFGNPQDVTNKVLMYLLGKEDEPIIAEALRQYDERSVSLSRQWIEVGQQHGVIPPSVDAAKTAELFVMLTFGLRVRSSIPQGGGAVFGAEELSSFMARMLQSR